MSGQTTDFQPITDPRQNSGIEVAFVSSRYYGPPGWSVADAEQLRAFSENPLVAKVQGPETVLVANLMNGNNAFFDTAGCVSGDIVIINDGKLECFSRRVVFATSGTFNGDLKTAGHGSNGLNGADNLCQQAADSDGSIVPPGEYVAWLSSSTSNARDRLAPLVDDGYILPDRTTIIAANKSDLLAGSMLNPINQDENGAVLSGDHAWTGTTFDGTSLTDVSTAETCNDWSTPSELNGVIGIYGDTGLKEMQWNEVGTLPCDNPLHIYCFQQ
jgi:hypothetical protein